MSLLSRVAQLGELLGLRIGLGMQLLYQLFVDDAKIFLKAIEENFLKATSLILVNKCISRAQLNLHKSLLI